MKKCNDCKIEKQLKDFYKSTHKPDGLTPKCKECTKKRNKEWRKNNPQKHKAWFEKQDAQRKVLLESFHFQGCVKCGESRRYVLDAHHVNPDEKTIRISQVRVSLDKLKKELTKCISLCSNCHREYHYLEKKNNINIKEFLK